MIRDTEDRDSIRPKPHFIESIRAHRAAWPVLVAEAFDNMLDADCRRGEIDFGPSVRLRDDGMGITRDRERAVLRLGDHGHMATTSLGVFGMGITWNLMSSCERVTVRSISRDGQLDLAVDWSKALANDWRIDLPRWAPVAPTRPTGTMITLSRLRWVGPTARELQRLRERLAVQFQPALASGKVLRLDGETLPVLVEPPLRFPVRSDVEIRPGKGAQVSAGMLAAPSKLLREVHLTKGHRVLDIGAFGCGAYPGIAAMFARVTLTGSWTLTPFKDGLSQTLAQDAADVSALEALVHEVLLPLLERCQAQAMTAQVEEMVRLVNDLTPDDLMCVRPPRKKPREEPKPAPGPKRKRPQHQRSSEGEPSGPARRRQPQSPGLLIDFKDDLAEEHGVGEVKLGNPARVNLAKDNPFVAAFMTTRHNKPASARVLNLIALALYEYALEKAPLRNEDPRQQRIAADLLGLPFGVRLARRLAQQRVNADLADEEAAGA